MKKLLLASIAFISIISANAQESNTWAEVSAEKKGKLEIKYLENFPFCYKDDKGNLTGIEIDIIKAFREWLFAVKEVEVELIFTPSKEFTKVYEGVKNSPKPTIGLATVTVTKERMADLQFSPPYLKNTSLFISAIDVPTLNAMDEIPSRFGELTAVTVKGSKSEQDLLKLKEKYLPNLRVSYVTTPAEIAAKIDDGSGKYFGYVDLITYWDYVKKKGGKIKIHRLANDSRERFAFIMPKNSDWQPILNEYFEGGFGLTSTEDYVEILQKHLGFEVVRAVELY